MVVAVVVVVTEGDGGWGSHEGNGGGYVTRCTCHVGFFVSIPDLSLVTAADSLIIVLFIMITFSSLSLSVPQPLSSLLTLYHHIIPSLSFS